jgi:type II secretory pathway component PulC
MLLKTIFRNINLLNILLMSVIIISIIYSLSPFLDTKVKYTLPTAKKILEQKGEEAVHMQTPSIAEYTVIAEENLFHPERKIPVEKKQEQPLPKPEFVLYGTLITDDISMAYLEDLKAPQSSPGRGKRQTALRKGETMSGFTLKDVETEKILMVRGEENIEVYLNDDQRPKKREIVGPGTQATPGKPAPAPANVSKRPPSTRKAPSSVKRPVRPGRALSDFFNSGQR